MITAPVRLGSVNYLNARPLVAGLEEDRSGQFDVRFDTPARCAALLDAGEIDLGLIPAIAYHDRPGDCVVPGVSIASEGPVASVALFTRRPLGEIRSIALDTSSRTSVALTRILCARRFGIEPALVRHAPDLPAMMAAHDAALIIGDAALFADVPAAAAAIDEPCAHIAKIDLGTVWFEMTGLPFVWAFWSGRADAAPPDVVTRLQRTRDDGLGRTDALADAYVVDAPERAPLARGYLRESIKYGLTPRMLEGLRAYYREALGLRIITHEEPLRFFSESTT